uniref:Sulfotransferase domain-containing protein n=1 Tax=Brassica oleracea var. oleracea TaxID=109376 RepID=A0A0D3E7U4_BRAOL
MSSSSSVPDYLRDEKLTQETRDLISSLPSEKGWLVSQIYQFQGRWHTEALLQGILTCQKHFKAKDSDIILVTNPKSGTTWLKSLVFALINRHKFPVSSGDHPLLVTNPHLLVPFMEGVYYESPDFDFSLLPFPRLMNTHISHLSLPESVKSSSCQIVYCCRNPKDMFVSLWHFGKKLAPQETADYPLEKAVEAFCQGKFIAGPFWDHVLEYWYASLENPNKVLFVTYEELKKQTEVEVKRIAEFIGCGFTAEEEVSEIVKLCSFESLSRLEVNRQGKLPNGIETNAFFRKGEIGGWRDTLSESLADAIDRTTEEKFGDNVQRIKRVLAAEELSKQRTLRSLCCKTFKYEWQNKRNPKDVFVLLWYFMKSLILKEMLGVQWIKWKSPISLNVSSDEQLKAGRCRQRVVTRLLRFWKARNAKKDEKLMGVDLLLLDRKIPSNLIQATINVHRLKTFSMAGWLWFSLYGGRFHHSSLVLRCASAASSSSNAATAKAPKPSGCNIRAASSSNSTSDREAICSIRLKKMIPLQVEELRGQGAEQYAYKWEKDTVQISSTRCTNEDFLTALEYGMPPPASGMAGDAVDKLCEYKRRHCVSCSEGSAVIIAPNVDPNPDPDIRRILQFLEEYPTSGYPRTPDPDKDSKILDPPDKDPDLDTLKLPGYSIRLRPIINTGHY